MLEVKYFHSCVERQELRRKQVKSEVSNGVPNLVHFPINLLMCTLLLQGVQRYFGKMYIHMYMNTNFRYFTCKISQRIVLDTLYYSSLIFHYFRAE